MKARRQPIKSRSNRTSTIAMRTTHVEKDFLLKASELAGFSNLTNFILTAARKEAVHVLNDMHATHLSQRDWNKVVDLIENPPEPNEALKDLLAKREE